MKDFLFNIKKEFIAPRGIVSPSNEKLNNLISEEIPFKTINFKSGSKVDSWVVPNAWELKSSKLIINSEKINLDKIPLFVPFGTESFSLVGKLNELKDIIQTIPNQPLATPYRTNYYSPKNKMVCLPFYILQDKKEESIFEIEVKSNTYNSAMQIKEVCLKGKSKNEILLTAYNCHPGLGNDNFSGIIGLCYLYKKISQIKNRHFTYRFAFFPETIGAIFYINYLSMNNLLKDIIVHKVLTCLGGTENNYSFKDSKIYSKYVESFKYKIKQLIPNLKIENYKPDGSDERQFSSPNVSIPSFSLCRNRYYDYSQYHTSHDNLKYMNEANVYKTSEYIYEALLTLDNELRLPKSVALFGEPHLSSYNINFNGGGSYNPKKVDEDNKRKKCIMELISCSDGMKSEEELIILISEKLEIDLKYVEKVFIELVDKGVIIL